MSTFNQTSKPHAPALIPIHQPSSSRESKWKDAPVKAALRSPFFHPSNPRISTLQTPRGTARPSIVINDVTVKDLEKKSSLLGAYANLCNATIGAGIVCLVSEFHYLVLLFALRINANDNVIAICY